MHDDGLIQMVLKFILSENCHGVLRLKGVSEPLSQNITFLGFVLFLSFLTEAINGSIESISMDEGTVFSLWVSELS